MGEFNVQVKGKSVNELIIKPKKYSMKVKTLNAYKNNKIGTLLFVCEIVDIDNYQLYYANLLPVDIEDILKKVKNQKTISINITPVDSNLNSSKSLKSICINFLRESRKQSNITIKDIRQEDIKEINFQINVPENGFNLAKIANSDLYFYAITKNGEKIALPKADKYYVGQEYKAEISIDNVKYYDRFKIIHSSDLEEILCIGDSISINENNSKLNFKIQGNIANRINDLKFIINLFKNEYFYVDSYKMDFLIDKKFNIEEYESKLNDLLEAEKVLKFFNIELTEDIDKMDEETISNINKIVNYYNGIVTDIDVYEKNIYYMDIANNRVIFYFTNEENSRKIKLNNFLNNNDIKCFINNNIPISKYMFLCKKDILFLLKCRIDYNDVKNSLKEYYTKSLDSEYNNLELDLIRAFDEYNDERLLEIADCINELLIQNIDVDLSYMEMLNKMQIIKRRRNLSDEEQYLINNIPIDLDDKNYSAVICAKDILLNRVFDFKCHFSNMDNIEQENFKKLPIYNLIKKML